MTIPFVVGVNPLQTTRLELGIVSGRVALLPRSAEIHPVFERFVDGLRPSSTPNAVLTPGTLKSRARLETWKMKSKRIANINGKEGKHDNGNG
eukprot:627832-Hanusia_phi.AAC.1